MSWQQVGFALSDKLLSLESVLEAGEEIFVLLGIGKTLTGLFVDFSQLSFPQAQDVRDFVGQIRSVGMREN